MSPNLVQDTVKEALLWGKHCLSQAGITEARLEAEVLLAHILGRPRVALLVGLNEPLGPAALEQYRADLDRRAKGYPLQYLTGCQEFMSLPFAVGPGVLIPRPETEILVEAVISYCRQRSKPLSLVDVGTGSGAIALSLAHYLPGTRVYATDLSPAALHQARINAAALKAEVIFIQGDLLLPWINQGTKPALPPELDVVVANPPYIPTGQLAGLQLGRVTATSSGRDPYIPNVQLAGLQRELAYEPVLALDGGPDGLAVYRQLIPQAAQILAAGGLLALETGWDQAKDVASLIEAAAVFSQPTVLQDLAGKDRVLTAIKK
jgi:release factor glutamine methyltransferase